MIFKNNKIRPCVAGLGYVGLPVFLQLQKKFKVIGYDNLCNNTVLSKYKIRKSINRIKNKIDIAVFLINHKKNRKLFNYFNKKGVKILDPFNFYK